MTKTNSSATHNMVYQIVTEAIIQRLKNGIAPWRRSWVCGTPRNLISKKAYRGINNLILSYSEFASPYWLTFNQAIEAGGYIKKGAKSTPVVFWKFYNTESESDTDIQPRRRPPLARYYRIFNIEQTEGLDHLIPEDKRIKSEFTPIEAAAQLIENMPRRPDFIHTGNRAYYSPKHDCVTLPRPEAFTSPDNYYAVLFHEHIHSTGHNTRLNRQGVSNNGELSPFGSPDYSKEELIAEIGSAFLCARTGINSTIETSADYIGGWLQVLENDLSMIISAAGAAQQAADYIFGEIATEQTEDTTESCGLAA